MKLTSLAPGILITIAILSSGACKKSKRDPNSDNGLPPATQTGQMKFACYVNGVAWIAARGSMGNTGMGGGANNIVYAFGSYGPGVYFQALRFQTTKPVSLGVAITLDDDQNYFNINGDHDCTSINIGPYVYRGKGWVKFTRLDRENKIMSGTFECTIPVPGCDTLKMTAGRFDIRYYN